MWAMSEPDFMLGLQSYGRDPAAVNSLARSMPALQGLTYEGTGNGLGIGYGMMQSHSLGNAYMVPSCGSQQLEPCSCICACTWPAGPGGVVPQLSEWPVPAERT